MPRISTYRDNPAAVQEVVEGVIAGQRGALARALRLVDDAPDIGRELVSQLHQHRGHTHVVGITGNPGAGKSTVTDKLIAKLRAADKKIAVLAVDPSSPFSGGAILGDRIRMSQHFGDDEVFIRSLATRGALGGLSRSTFDSVRVLDAAGFDIVLLETVGVGQDEVDVVRLADTTVVVMVPGLGDDIQAIKAGLLEIADVFLVNKADREGVNEVERGLRHMMGLAPVEGEWEPAIIRSVAPRGQGIDELYVAIEEHRVFLESPAGASRRRLRQRELFHRMFDNVVVELARERLHDQLDAAAQRVLDEEADPYSTVLELLK